ncbi:glycosyl hydrolase family 3 N terminal domain-containing protein [Colletotrichum navitas]|uniref:Beta-glucosidase cel3A n=1 Tax=Colletotrichum navitas TaxID=681940 RepID=A0AAD8V0A3_9PEZI|nr:glycosyl hydrolase family 3 N terminal domain-containing protein [Colletotrichum navitas]KAK1573015.1 glycosyl hydrolase family 3 N terminal domain-containing protein [Colletotrichum navitas]
MSVLSIIRYLPAFALLLSATVAQIPPDLPIDGPTRQYLETLPPDKLAAILKIYEQAIAGQIPAPPELIEQQELYWSYERSPPVYPTPRGEGLGDWSDAYNEAEAIVKQMTLDEKVSVVSGQTSVTNGCAGMIPGVPRLGFPGICVQDGPNGLHGVEAVNGYASAITVGAAWNKELAHARGVAMGLEAKAKGVNNLIGPTMGPLGRTVLGGRNWESFSVDPYLCGVMGAQTILGQQENVIATAKHFIVNEQETNRQPSMFGFGNASVSVTVDDKTMHELYLWPFQDAVKAGVGSVMCSYNRINGSHGCQNSYTQNGLLKKELNFQGYVITDSGALHSGIASVNAGADVTTPYNQVWGKNLTAAIANNTMSMDRLDDMVTRWLKLARFEPGTGMPIDVSSPHKVVSSITQEQRATVFQGAVEGIVLVKNVNETLPLRKPAVLSLFGYDAQAPAKNTPEGFNSKHGLGFQSVNVTDEEMQGLFIGFGDFPAAARLGTLISGGGSPSVVPAYIDSPHEAFQQRALEDGTFLLWDFESQDPVYANAGSNACIVFINEFASEGSDRQTLADPWSDQLVLNVASKCPNTIVSIHNSGTRLVDRWIDHPNVTAVLFAHLPGQDAGRSLVEVMYGIQAPSGRLPYTVAKNESDYGELLHPVTADNTSNYYTSVNFTEGVYIDYRRFDALNITPRYEFGFGLTYTTFEYSSLNLSLSTNATTLGPLPPPSEPAEGGASSLWDVVAVASVDVKNMGNVSAPEVPQLYVGIPGAPEKQLRGFEKVPLNPLESKTVSFPLTRRDLSVWDVVQQNWVLQKGDYKVYVGASSRDVRVTGVLSV